MSFARQDCQSTSKPIFDRDSSRLFCRCFFVLTSFATYSSKIHRQIGDVRCDARGLRQHEGGGGRVIVDVRVVEVLIGKNGTLRRAAAVERQRRRWRWRWRRRRWRRRCVRSRMHRLQRRSVADKRRCLRQRRHSLAEMLQDALGVVCPELRVCRRQRRRRWRWMMMRGVVGRRLIESCRGSSASTSLGLPGYKTACSLMRADRRHSHQFAALRRLSLLLLVLLVLVLRVVLRRRQHRGRNVGGQLASR